ncbi:MAG TPA: hypothetical protein VGG06_21835 [Thermoanaerobaculia bacterium]
MTAFDLTHWCDYARGVAAPESTPSMRALLERSEPARKAVERFRRVASVAGADAAGAIPAHAVLVAKAVAALAPRVPSAASRRFLPAELTFDSTHAAGVGTRDLCPSHQRIASYRAGELSVHVRLEHETTPYGRVLVGQLLRHAPAPLPVTEVPVLVLAAGKVVGRSLTSRFGEFQADGLPPDPLALCLLVEPERWIEVSLGSLPEV